MIGSLFISVCAVAVGGWMIYTILSLAPWLPTRARDMSRIGRLASLESFLPDEEFYDLGSGDGRVVLALAKLYPNVQFVGVEMSFVLHVIATVRVAQSNSRNIRLVRGNIYTQDYSNARVLYVFGTQRTLNGSFATKILPQIRSGAMLLTYNFSLEDWPGESEKDQPVGLTPIYTYKVNRSR